MGGVPLTFLEAKRENSEKQSFHISPVPLFLLKNKNNLKFISRFINSFYFCTVIQYLRKYDKRGKGALYTEMSDSQRDFIETITNYNIEARYPEDKDTLSRMLTEQTCRILIDETKLLQQWIKDRL